MYSFDQSACAVADVHQRSERNSGRAGTATCSRASPKIHSDITSASRVVRHSRRCQRKPKGAPPITVSLHNSIFVFYVHAMQMSKYRHIPAAMLYTAEWHYIQNGIWCTHLKLTLDLWLLYIHRNAHIYSLSTSFSAVPYTCILCNSWTAHITRMWLVDPGCLGKCLFSSCTSNGAFSIQKYEFDDVDITGIDLEVPINAYFGVNA